MKKLTLTLAVLAVIAISLVSFSAFKFSSSTNIAKDDQTQYRWILWGCRDSGTPFQYVSGPNGSNAFVVFGEQEPTPNYCPGSYGKICAVRFLASETDPYPGGGCQPKAGVTVWGVGRPYLICK